MDMDMDLETARCIDEKHMEQKKSRKRRQKLRKGKKNFGENMELCGFGEQKQTLNEILEVKKVENSNSGMQDTLLDVDLTAQSPLQKPRRRRRKSRKGKENLGENVELCGFGDQKQTVSENLEVKEMEISNSGLQDTLLDVDLTVQSPLQKPRRRRRKSRKGKENLGGNMELCGFGEQKQTVSEISEVIEMEVSNSGLQETLPNVDLTVRSPLQKDLMDTTTNLEESKAKKKKRRRKRSRARESLQSLDHTEAVPVLSLSDKPNGVGGSDKLNNLQGTNQELRSSASETSRYWDKSDDGLMNDRVADVGNVNNFLNTSHSSPERTPVARLRRKLLILDVNGLLADVVCPAPKERRADVHILRRAVFRRPFCCDFLKFCFERFDVGIWSSRSRKVLDRLVDYLLGDLKHKLLLFWDMSHCTKSEFKTPENRHKAIVFKELRKIWEKSDPYLPWKKGDYNESNTVLMDDSPYKALLNPTHTGIFPFSYSFKDGRDNSLGPGGDIRLYLEGLASADNCKEYVEKHPFGQSGIDESSSLWAFYSNVLCSVNRLIPSVSMVRDDDIQGYKGPVTRSRAKNLGGIMLRDDQDEGSTYFINSQAREITPIDTFFVRRY